MRKYRKKGKLFYNKSIDFWPSFLGRALVIIFEPRVVASVLVMIFWPSFLASVAVLTRVLQ